MIIKPYPLSAQTIPQEEANQDKKTCKVFGPCGVGKKAVYLNSFYIDRRYYIPFSAIQRIYKRVAMSKGGFTGKGVFASIPYLVVEYDGGKEKQCNFKYEEQVDQLLAYVEKEHPEIKLHSAKAEAKLAQAAAERAALTKADLSNAARKSVESLKEARAYLEKRPDLTTELSQAARRQRAQSISKPVWRWVAAAVILGGFLAAGFGAYQLITHQGSFGIYFVLFGAAAILLFSGVSVAPTARNNKRSIAERWENAKNAMVDYLRGYPGQFPLPPRYAHPIVLTRMIRAIEQGRATWADDALDVVKADLKALNADVKVSQEEYDEVIAIKAMFLNEDYR